MKFLIIFLCCVFGSCCTETECHPNGGIPNIAVLMGPLPCDPSPAHPDGHAPPCARGGLQHREYL